MLQTLLCIFLISISGSVLTYLYSEEDSPLVRLGAGNVIGSVLFGLAAFLLGCAFGLTMTTVLMALLIALLPLVLLVKKDLREKFLAGFEMVPEINSKTLKSVAYYLAFLLVFYFFFERAMYENQQGIGTGATQNYGDLPFHLGAIFSFTEGQNLPPENPSYAFAKFTYPFMMDFLTACFMTLGAKVREAMLWQNVTLAFSLVVLFEKFAWRLMKNRLAGKLAPVIFLLCGGLGFIIFFRDYWNDGRGIWEFIWKLPADYTIRLKGIRWGNSLTTLFITQRSFLLGMPLTIIVLTKLWEIFTAETPRQSESKTQTETEKTVSEDAFSVHSKLGVLFIGLLAGTLPLIHVHSLAVLFWVSAFLFFFSLKKWRVWILFGLAVTVVALPELLWIMTGSATRLKEFIGWHFGWDSQKENIIIFWMKNLGLFLPLLIVSLISLFPARKRAKVNEEKEKPDEVATNPTSTNQSPNTDYRLLIFYLPFLLIFFISNLVKLAPWEWDNIKVLIYWFVASVPLVAWLLASFWEEGLIYKFVVAGCLIVLTFSGALDVWRVASGQVNYGVFSPDSVKIAEQIKQKVPPKALFLNAPTFNSAVVLSGRRSLMRYTGHLSSYGIDYYSREDEVKRMYEGTALAEYFLKKYNIEYVLISPEETLNLKVNQDFFSKYPIIAESGDYRVYQIKK